MKLSYIKPVGRYKLPDKKIVNIKKGRVKDRGVDVLFYLYRGERIFVSDFDFSKAERIV